MPTVIGSSQPVKAEKKPAPQKSVGKKKKDFFVESKEEDAKEKLNEETLE